MDIMTERRTTEEEVKTCDGCGNKLSTPSVICNSTYIQDWTTIEDLDICTRCCQVVLEKIVVDTKKLRNELSLMKVSSKKNHRWQWPHMDMIIVPQIDLQPFRSTKINCSERDYSVEFAKMMKTIGVNECHMTT